MQTQSLYEKYGGQDTVNIVIDKFYVRMLSDDKVKHFFADTDMDKLKTHQRNFVAIAMGGPNSYDGKNMRAAHENMGLNDEHFDALVDNMTDSLDECGVTEEDIAAIIGKVETYRDACLLR